MSFLVGLHVKEWQDTFPEVNVRFLPSTIPLDLVAEGSDMGIRTGSVVDQRRIGREVGVQFDKVFYRPAAYAPDPPIGDIKLTNGLKTIDLNPSMMREISRPFPRHRNDNR